MKKKLIFMMVFVLITGWFCTVAEANAKTKEKSQIMYVIKNAVVRKKPSSKAGKAGIVYALDRVRMVETDKGWSTIRYKHKQRYVKRKYLTKKKPKYVIKSAPSNSFKSYESYRKLHYKQGRLQERAHTDKNGLRKVDNRYCIAMGSYYSTKIGCKIDLLMSDGQVIKCILADMKSDRHTNRTHQKHIVDGSVVEFVVDARRLTKKVKRYGDISKISRFRRSVRKVRVYK